MKKYTNKIFSKLLIIFIFAFVYSNQIHAKSSLEINENDFVIGISDAPVTIIEYASLSCSHCASFHLKTLPSVVSEYVETGKVKFVFRDFPFNFPALLGSMVLRCVPNDIRYDYTQALYKLQSQWVNRENAKTSKELYKIMQSGGMTKEEYDNCIGNSEVEKEILDQVMTVQGEFNIRSTPSFLINGKLIEGNKPFSDFKKIIDNLLKE